MQVHVTQAPALWMIVFGTLLFIVLAIVIGSVAFAIVRRRDSVGVGTRAAGAGSLVMSAVAIGFFLLLLITLAIGVPVMQQSREVERRTGIQTRLHQIGEELHARDAFEQARPPRDRVPVDASIPTEAARPQDSAELAARDPLPEWVAAGDVEQGDRTLVVVSGEQFADPRTARDNAMSKAERLVRDDFRASHDAAHESWSPAAGMDAAVKNSHTEEIRRTAGEHEFTVYRTHLQVELSPSVREALEPIWRQQVGVRRSVIVAAILALFTVVAAIVSGYFRLDDRTGGRYRWRLRAGAIAATMLVGAALLGGTRLAAEAVRPPDPLTVQEATPQPVSLPMQSAP